MHKLLAIIILLLALTPPGHAAQVGGPIAGFALDETAGVIRPIVGIPGAMSLGAPLQLGPDGSDVIDAVFSIDRDYALTAAADGGIRIVRQLTGAAESASIPGIRPAPDRILLSPSGTTAALYFSADESVQIVAGLPEDPTLLETWRLPVADPAALAISDGEPVLLVGASEGAGGAIYALRQGLARFVAAARNPAALAFLKNRQDAVAADGALQEVFLLRNVWENPARRVLVRDGDALRSPAAIAISADGSTVFTAANDGKILAANLDGAGIRTIECMCRPTRLEVMKGGAVFRLNALGTEPLFIAEAGADRFRLVLVPVYP